MSDLHHEGNMQVTWPEGMTTEEAERLIREGDEAEARRAAAAAQEQEK
jgi:hypothetical protein